jgi:hypothetical protein
MHKGLDRRSQRLRVTVATLTPGGQRRYPPGLRSEIADYARARMRAGGVRRDVVAELGVSDPTLVRILSERETTPKLRPVRVVASRPARTEVSPLVVRTVGGLQIEGLDVAGVAALVRALT